MSERDRATPHPPTADRMRHDISRGKAGDKVDHPDSSAAPLGTDDEAAGNPPSVEELRTAAATAPSKRPERNTLGAAMIYAAIVIAIIAVVGVAALSPR